jgi:hypothetical protein
MLWRRRLGMTKMDARPWLIVAGALATLLAPGHGRAADQAQDTGKICSVSLSSSRTVAESLNSTAGAAAIARSVQAEHCQAGDILEMSYAEGDPVPVMAQLCDFGRQIHVYNTPPSYAQVGISSELVCSLIGTRRSNR